ncbi:hypothetical protein [Deminuibacter soli]|uniref:hypothetical protein n=1 Tax=Deminuibacter soli TaxID=2291815 RepID=UPI001314D388|nr:hypothetical protein [Deminuibacter soli]
MTSAKNKWVKHYSFFFKTPGVCTPTPAAFTIAYITNTTAISCINKFGGIEMVLQPGRK